MVYKPFGPSDKGEGAAWPRLKDIARFYAGRGGVEKEVGWRMSCASARFSSELNIKSHDCLYLYLIDHIM